MMFSDAGKEVGFIALDVVGNGNAWGIAAQGESMVVGGRGVAGGGFVVQLRADADVEGFTVPEAVFDVDFDGETIWVSGQLGDAPIVGAYDIQGGPVPFDTLADQLPPSGTAWDLAAPAGSGSIYVAAANGSGTAPWIASVSIDEAPAWAAEWTVPGDGAAYGIALMGEGELVASGNVGGSGIVAVLDAITGVERWSQTLTSTRGQFANIHKAVGGPAGEVVGVGWVATSDTDADIWVGKYSPEGELLWERTFAGTGGGDSNGWGVAVDDAGFITAVGGIADAGTGDDWWVVHLEP
jgi:hypothetical protein